MKIFSFLLYIFLDTHEPHHEKTCLWGFRPGKTQTGLLGFRSLLVSWNFGFSKYRYYTFQAANNKGADQTAQMRRLICAFLVRIGQKQVFSWWGSYISDFEWNFSNIHSDPGKHGRWEKKTGLCFKPEFFGFFPDLTNWNFRVQFEANPSVLH